MPGVGKLLKQAQKMQAQMQAAQSALEAREIEVSSGGGAVQVKITGGGKFAGLTLDPEFLKEDPKLVAETILAAVQEASTKAKALHEEEMGKITATFQVPGMF